MRRTRLLPGIPAPAEWVRFLHLLEPILERTKQ